MLGTNEEFSTLMEELKDQNIGVILDGVFNHTGADSKYFNALGTYDMLGAAQRKSLSLRLPGLGSPVTHIR